LCISRTKQRFDQMQQFQHITLDFFLVTTDCLVNQNHQILNQKNCDLTSKCLDLKRLLSSPSYDRDSSQSSGNDIDGLVVFDEIRV